MSTIKVRLKDASGNVLHPETDWSVVQNKPSIVSYPGEGGTCIGDIGGFRVYYSDNTFNIYIVNNIESGNYTLGFLTPGALLGGTKPVFAFFVDILDLIVETTEVVDDQFLRLSWRSGAINPGTNGALGLIGDQSSSIEKIIAADDTTYMPINIDETGQGEYPTIDYLSGGSGEMFLSSFSIDQFTPGDKKPVFISVAKQNA